VMYFDEQTADEFASVARRLALQPTLKATLQAIVEQVLVAVPGAEEASITLSASGGRLATVASTGTLPEQVDELQYATNEGPCVDALRDERAFVSDNVGIDPRWPIFGPRAVEYTEVLSMLCHRLYLEDSHTIGALNLYSRKPAAFDDDSRAACMLLAAHAAMALATAAQKERNEHLETALTSNRRIGMAVGILMSDQKLTEDQAFDLLRVHSQHIHRKLRDIAEDVIATGALGP
jgi:GAF domain-containing protein